VMTLLKLIRHWTMAWPCALWGHLAQDEDPKCKHCKELLK
jgi:hypothetical protein